jgi:hypothetical protein
MDSPLQLSEHTPRHKFGPCNGFSIFCGHWVATCLTCTVDLFLKCVLLTDRRSFCPDDLLFLSFAIQVPLVSFILFLPIMTADVILFRYRNSSQTHQKKPLYSLSGSVCCLVTHSKFCLCRQFSVAVMQCFSFLLHHWYDAVYPYSVHSYVQEISCTKVTLWMLAHVRFPRAAPNGTSATGCKLCRAPLPEFSNVVYFVYGLFVADVAFMVLTSVRYRHCLWTKGICNSSFSQTIAKLKCHRIHRDQVWTWVRVGRLCGRRKIPGCW